MGMVKGCDNCIYSGRPSYEYPCTVCETAYGSAPSKWEGMVSATSDMVEVVRCKDCKYRKKQVCANPSAGMWSGVELRENDCCSYGERRSDG